MGNKFQRIDDVKQKISNLELASKFEKLTNKILKKGITKKQTIIICSLLIACLIVVLIPSKQVETPEGSISKIETAIFNADTATISKLIKIDNIANSMAKQVLAEVQSKSLTADLLSYMQKELENKIVADFLNIIENKGNYKANLTNHNAVLSKTLNFLLAENGVVTKKTVSVIDEKNSEVDIVVFRPNLNKEVTVKLVFTHNDYDWILTDIANIDELLKQLESLEQERIAQLNKGIKEKINQVLVLRDFQKSNVNLQDNSFLIRISLENISKEDIKHVKAKLNILDKDLVIGSIDISINDTIFANNFYEQAWSIKLTDYESLRHIVKTRSVDFNVNFEIQEVAFMKGDALTLTK